MLPAWLTQCLRTKRSSFIHRVSARRARCSATFERLECRRYFAFTSLVNGDTLELTQTANDGSVYFDRLESGWQVEDDTGVEFIATVASNLSVEMIAGSDHINFFTFVRHMGDITLNIGDSDRPRLFRMCKRKVNSASLVVQVGGQTVISWSWARRLLTWNSPV